MADNASEGTTARTPLGTAPKEAPEVHVGRMPSLSMDVGGELGQQDTTKKVDVEPDKGITVNVDGKDATVERADPEKSQEGAAQPETTESKPEGEQAQTGTLPELPEFDAAKPETVEAYDKAFLKGEGDKRDFNMEALSADWARNVKVDPKTGDFDGGLSESTYKWLESRGVDRATAKAIEAGQVAQIKLQRQEVFGMAGGEQRYNAALAWARGDAANKVPGGYSKEAAAQFNEALNKGGAARKDAIDLLMTRYDKANPPRRPVTPQRTTANNATAPQGAQSGVKPYANYAEYQADLRKARADKDQNLLNQSRERLKASPWYTGNQK